MIKLKKISKQFDKHYIINNINLEFYKNEIVAIIGPSGSGKSTLLRIISALENPTSGYITINNQILNKKNRKELCCNMGMVFQNFNLFPHLNVENNLIYAPINTLKITKTIAIDKAKRLLDQFNLVHKINHFPIHLSGGEKQKVAICRAIIMDPHIILLDEPTSALDTESIINTIKIVSSIKNNTTIIITTHNIKFAKTIADRIIFLDYGEVLEDQSSQKFFKQPKSDKGLLFLKKIQNLL